MDFFKVAVSVAPGWLLACNLSVTASRVLELQAHTTRLLQFYFVLRQDLMQPSLAFYVAQDGLEFLILLLPLPECCGLQACLTIGSAGDL